MDDVYVLGIDMMRFGRFPERTVPQLGAQAALMALDDAGLTIQRMQALYCGNLGEATAMEMCIRDSVVAGDHHDVVMRLAANRPFCPQKMCIRDRPWG